MYFVLQKVSEKPLGMLKDFNYHIHNNAKALNFFNISALINFNCEWLK
jgi:hypothetical protein